MNALLHQVLASNRHLLIDSDMILDQYKLNGDKIFGSFTGLWRVFGLAVCRQETICVLDALDECPEDDRKQLFRALGEDRIPSLKVLFTSRPYDRIRRQIIRLSKEEVPLVQVQGDRGVSAESIEDEIGLVIKHRIDTLPVQLSRTERETLQLQIESIQNRTYLWVTLVFDGLMDKDYLEPGDIVNLGSSLPKGLPDAYEKILSKSGDWRKTKKLLSIVLAAERPLTTLEVATALATDGQPSWTEARKNIVPRDRIEESIRDLCGLFVTVVEEKVYFLHQTAREFLLSERTYYTMTGQLADPGATSGSLNTLIPPRSISQKVSDVNVSANSSTSITTDNHFEGLNRSNGTNTKASTQTWQGSMSLAESNAVLAEVCFFHLQQDFTEGRTLSSWSEANSSSWAEPEAFEETDPFSVYCARYCIRHYCQSTIEFQKTSAEKARDLCLLAPNSSIWEYVHPPELYEPIFDPPFEGPPLCRASAFGLVEAVRLLLQPQNSARKFVDLPDDVGTPLYWAASQGAEGVCNLLIKAGAKADTLGPGSRWAPLVDAAAHGSEGICKLLLNAGAKVNMPDLDGRTPLFWAAGEGQEGVCNLLIKAGANVNTSDSDGCTPLGEAARRGDESVCKLLITARANVNMLDLDRTPLWWAASKGEEGICKLLIEAGANVDMPDPYNRKPLWWAAKYGEEGICRLLINAGADVNIPDLDGRTPLWWAASKGEEGVCNLLIEEGANVDMSDLDGCTPLMRAARCSDKGVYRLLIEAGAKAGAPDRRRSRTLQGGVP